MYEEVLEGDELDEIGLGDDPAETEEEEEVEDDVVPEVPVEEEM